MAFLPIHERSALLSAVLALGLLLGPSRRVCAEEPTAPRPSKVIAVIVEGDAEIDDAILRETATLATDHLEVWGLSPEQVRLSFKLLDEDELNYGIQVWIHTDKVSIHDDIVATMGVRFKVCEACLQSALPNAASEALLLALEEYRTRLEGGISVGSSTVVDTEPSPLSAPSSDSERERPRRLSPHGWAGIACLVLGAAAYGTGAVLARGSKDAGSSSVTLQPAPLTLLIGASVPTVIGAVLLTIDRARHRRSRPPKTGASGSARASWSPVLRF